MLIETTVGPRGAPIYLGGVAIDVQDVTAVRLGVRRKEVAGQPFGYEMVRVGPCGLQELHYCPLQLARLLIRMATRGWVPNGLPDTS